MKRTSAFCVSVCWSMVFSVNSQQVGFSRWVLQGSPSPHTAVISYEPSVLGWLGELLRVERAGASKESFSGGPPPAYPAGSAPSWGSMDSVAPQVGSGVNLFNGNLLTSVPIVSWRNGLSFALYHNSLESEGLSSLSSGWRHSYSQELRFAGQSATLINEEGSRVEFSLIGEAPYRHAIYRLELSPTETGWVIEGDQGGKSFFNTQGRLESLKDASGNQTLLKYSIQGKLIQVSDPSQRHLDLSYSADGKLKHVQAPPFNNGAGLDDTVVRRFELGFSEGKLSKVFSPRRWGYKVSALSKFSRQFLYDELGRLEKLSDYGEEFHGGEIEPATPGKGWYFWTVTYHGQSGKVAQLSHPVLYDFALDQMVANSRAYAYQSLGAQGIETQVSDESGGITRYHFDTSGRLREVIDPLDRLVSQRTWTNLNLPSSTTNALGMATTLVYDERGNPLTQSNFRGTVQSSFDALDRLTQIEDSLGQITQYIYDYEGLPSDQISPRLIKELRGPGTANRAKLYWSANTPVAAGQACSPINGQPTGMSDPNGVNQSFHYDSMGNFTQSEFGNTDPNESCNPNEPPSPECFNTDHVVESSQLTGEPSESKVPIYCPLVLASGPSDCEDPGDPPENTMLGCPRGGNCSTDYDAAGNKVGNGCCGLFAATPTPHEDEPTGNFRYDANNRLVYALDERGKFPNYCAVDGKQGAQMDYRLQYDRLGNLSELTQQFAHGNDCDNEDARYASLDTCLGDIHWFPKQRQTYQSSISTRSALFLYEKLSWTVPSCETYPQMQRDPILTIQRFDAAGRLKEIEREGSITQLVHRDSLTLPALEMIRPDGSKTLTWVDPDGMPNKIVHVDSQGALIQQLSYTRDALGRILTETRESRNGAAGDGYETSRREYVYGSGQLSEEELDETSEPNPQKLYYRFLKEMKEGFALQPSDPNRLVSERLLNLDQTPGAKEYWNEYRYDPGGNRLVQVEKSASGIAIATTRYNYATASFDLYAPPGTPSIDANWDQNPQIKHTDYEGHGRNFLISTQRFVHVGSVQPVSANSNHQIEFTNYLILGSMGFRPAGKLKQFWQRSNAGAWSQKRWEMTRFHYQGEPNSSQPDPEMGGMLSSIEFEAGNEESTLEHWKERYAHDLFGRRVATHFDPNPYEPWLNDRNTIFTDYGGLSQNAIAQRKGARVEKGGAYVGDRFLKTFGLGTLTDESQDDIGNFDTSDNRDHYPLYDVMGNVSALLLDHDGDSKTSRIAKFQIHDAFGNLITRSAEELGSYSWRGGEGSETDSHSGLVYMQARYYDPEIGRFIQADSLPITGLTTQSMNRYIYCNNDPINFSDPSGHMAALAVLPIPLLGAIILALLMTLLIAIALAALLALISSIACFMSDIVDGAGFGGGLGADGFPEPPDPNEYNNFVQALFKIWLQMTDNVEKYMAASEAVKYYYMKRFWEYAQWQSWKLPY